MATSDFVVAQVERFASVQRGQMIILSARLSGVGSSG
jgi:hypothetical protein